MKSLLEKVARILVKRKIVTAMKPHTILRRLLVRPREKKYIPFRGYILLTVKDVTESMWETNRKLKK